MSKLLEKIRINVGKSREREIRFCGIPIFQYGKKEANGVVEKYFKIFPKSFEQKALSNVLKFIPEDHDHIWIVRTVGLGEAQLLNFMIDELKEKWGAKNPCFVSHRGIYKEMFKMYGDIPFYHLNIPYNEYAPYLKNRNVKYKGKWFHVHHCTSDESGAWLKKHQEGDVEHATISYLKFAGVKEYKQKYPKFSDEIISSALKKASKINLNLDNFVFFAPEANGTEKLPISFWIKLCEKFESQGFEVLVNTKDGIAKFGKTTELTIAESVYLATLSKKIVALRCGFSEILASLKDRSRLFVLYTKFRGISAQNFMKIYSLKEYPFIEKDSIVELVPTIDTIDNVFDVILK